VNADDISQNTAAMAASQCIQIRPTKGWVSVRWAELWAYRELLFFLMLRDITIRYKQTVLGAGWAIIQPVMTMVVFSVIIGRVAKGQSYGLPYPVFFFAAMLPWTFFSNGLERASNSLVGNSAILKKVYFPRLVIPISSVLSSFVDFCLAFLVQIALMIGYSAKGFSFVPMPHVLFLPLLLLIAFMTSLGAGLWLSAMNVQFRDVRYAVPFLAQMWFFVTPIIWGSAKFSEPWRTLCGLNPMASVVEGFRYALLGRALDPGFAPSSSMIALSVLSASLLLVGGVFYFARMERTFADVA